MKRSSKIVYFTLGDAYSGVYESQVIDTCQFLKKEYEIGVDLLGIIPPGAYKDSRINIIREGLTSRILPAIPGLSSWKMNKPLLNFYLRRNRPKVIISRGVFATCLAIKARDQGLVERIVYDGRGAVYAEWKEYLSKKFTYKKLEEIKIAEHEAITSSDFRIAVSNKLIEHWRNSYNYSGKEHLVIPCTLSTQYVRNKALNLSHPFNQASSVVLAYAGSTANWQSFSTMDKFISKWLSHGEQYKMLFLSYEDSVTKKLKEKYPDQVHVQWFKPEEVLSVLKSCDYGLLVREKSTTNAVSSPTKFAEYLFAGLSVIISDEIGDHSQFVIDQNCGVLESECGVLQKPDASTRIINNNLAKEYFFKESSINRHSYRSLLQHLELL
jgi:hypothetical protein